MNLTTRLAIHPLAESHAQDTFNSLQNQDIYHYIPDKAPLSIEALRVHYARLALGCPNTSEKWLNWVVYEQKSKNAIGTLQCTILNKEKKAYIAFVYFPEYWGKGYATEGATWLIDYLNKEEGIKDLRAEVDTRNMKSIALIEKLGFIRKETIPTDAGEDYIYIRSALLNRSDL